MLYAICYMLYALFIVFFEMEGDTTLCVLCIQIETKYHIYINCSAGSSSSLIALYFSVPREMAPP